MWYMFTPSIAGDTYYGWTENLTVAHAALACLNRYRDVNSYSMYRLGDDTDEFDLDDNGEMHNLKDRPDLLFDENSSVDDFYFDETEDDFDFEDEDEDEDEDEEPS